MKAEAVLITVEDVEALLAPEHCEVERMKQDKQLKSGIFAQTKASLVLSFKRKLCICYSLFACLCVSSLTLLGVSNFDRDESGSTHAKQLEIGLGLLVGLSLLSLVGMVFVTCIAESKMKRKLQWLEGAVEGRGQLAGWTFDRNRWRKFVGQEYGIGGRRARHYKFFFVVWVLVGMFARPSLLSALLLSMLHNTV